MLRLLQLTDLHVFAEPGRCLKGIPTRESLRDVLEYIHEHEGPFDSVVVTGDHTHDERPESYAAVLELLSPWRDRLHVVPGNHDDRRVLREVFKDIVSGSGDEKINFRVRLGEWLLAGLDTHVPGAVSGVMEASQVEWLKKTIENSDAAAVALFMHHPPVEVGSQWMDAIGLEGCERLQALVEQTPRIRLICCGHVHHEFEFDLAQAKVYTTPSTGVQFDPSGSVPAAAAEAPGYRVVEFEETEYSTHVVRLPEIKYAPVNE